MLICFHDWIRTKTDTSISSFLKNVSDLFNEELIKDFKEVTYDVERLLLTYCSDFKYEIIDLYTPFNHIYGNGIKPKASICLKCGKIKSDLHIYRETLFKIYKDTFKNIMLHYRKIYKDTSNYSENYLILVKKLSNIKKRFNEVYNKIKLY